MSPTEASFFESLSSLRFANTVSQCELGKPKRKLKDVSNDSGSSKSFPTSDNVEEVSAPTPSKKTPSATSSTTTAAAQMSSKKLNATWEGGSSVNRNKLATAETTTLSASLGAKRPLESSSAKLASSTKSRTTPLSRTASAPRTPARK